MRYILILLTVIIVSTTTSWIFNNLRVLYIYCFSKIETTKGFVLDFDKYVDYNGVVSYRYSVSFFAYAQTYMLKEQLSPDSLINIKANDSVVVRYSSSNPRIATLKKNGDLLNRALISLILLFVEIMMIRQSIVIIRTELNDKKLPDNFWESN